MVAAFAGGYQVVLGAFFPACKGKKVIHGEILVRHLLPAVVTFSGRVFLLPSAAFPQLSGRGLLAPDLSVIDAVKFEEIA